MERINVMAKETEIETKTLQTKELELEHKKLKMKCLEAAVSLRISGDPELIELKAEHFYNWIITGERK